VSDLFYEPAALKLRVDVASEIPEVVSAQRQLRFVEEIDIFAIQRSLTGLLGFAIFIFDCPMQSVGLPVLAT
jgi:hypothetical protein